MILAKLQSWVTKHLDFYLNDLSARTFVAGRENFSFKKFKHWVLLTQHYNSKFQTTSEGLFIAIGLLILVGAVVLNNYLYPLPWKTVLQTIVLILSFVGILCAVGLSENGDSLVEKCFKNFLFSIHAIIPGKKSRESRIIESLQRKESSPRVAPSFRIPSSPVSNSRGEDSLVREYQNLGTKKFCLKHFNQSGPGFIRFFKERAEDYTGKINEQFLIFAACIPKAKELSSDSLRKILINPILNYNFSYFKKGHLNLVFKNYEPLQIERIFTNHLGQRQIELLEYLTEPAKVYATIKELIDKEVYKSKNLSEELKKINNLEINGFKIKVLETYRDYTEASDTFRNCVRQRILKPGNILTFYYQGLPAICVQVLNGKIQEYCEYTTNSSSEHYKYFVVNLLKDYKVIN